MPDLDKNDLSAYDLDRQSIKDLAEKIVIEECNIAIFSGFKRRIYWVRLDSVCSGRSGLVSGNKVFKLLPSIKKAKAEGVSQLISFGGAWSNHLHALAAAGQDYSLDTVGIVRGERKPHLTACLSDAIEMGMRLQFVSRADYQRLQQPESWPQLQRQFGSLSTNSMVVPVGGSNIDGVLGAYDMGKAILQRLDADVSDIWLAAATGGTAAGMIAALRDSYDLGVLEDTTRRNGGLRQVTAVSVLRHCELAHEIKVFLTQIAALKPRKMCEKGTASQPWRLLDEYHCGGYARVNKDLLTFHQQLEHQLQEPVDQVYMAKLLFGLWSSLIAETNSEADTRNAGSIAVVWSGGQQGRRGLLADSLKVGLE